MPGVDDSTTEELVAIVAKRLVFLQEEIGFYGEQMIDQVRRAGAIILALDSRGTDWYGEHVEIFVDAIEGELAEYGISVGWP